MTTLPFTLSSPLFSRLSVYKSIGIIAIGALLLLVSLVAHDTVQAAKPGTDQFTSESTRKMPSLSFNPSKAVAMIDHSFLARSPLFPEPDASLLHSDPTAYRNDNQPISAD
jgi:hypothetical protein